MTPTADDFQALARSSPWRWTTLHVRHRATLVEDGVEAWVRRPGELVVRQPDGEVHRVHQQPGAGRGYVSSDPDFVPPEVRVPQDVVPMYRPDGLVAARPDDWAIEYDDPMWVNYRWVAALDPVELSHHVAVDDLRVDTVDARPVWRRRCVRCRATTRAAAATAAS
ncbi:hypothetical protein ASC77_08095 [Nocardioides sp. Root1257]|uniref:hypothetical protein n=1 Tax=unclassified Nocardioides TaxID=2615069 RepID=UPI0006F23C9E|nr:MULTISPECIES: hypothetical protein [unclassified Nocardioides]KQW48688.1 hypothetical protein ASC77_08095 [Nocardioides sp. Root1257]KRC47863.1 hypothetical protein ASE24_08100 [Nocardioides sp. Root224]